MNPHLFIHEAHQANSGELEALKTRIIDSGFAGTGIANNYSLGYDHIWREFNRRSDQLGQPDLMILPIDAGYRPQFGVIETGNIGV